MIYITATFRHSIKVEKAIGEIQQLGLSPTDILAIPLDLNDIRKNPMDTMHSADGKSLLDLPMLCAAIFSLFGCIYGFVWELGPVIWGVIGIFLGFSLGLLIKLLFMKIDKHMNLTSAATVVLMIACLENQAALVLNTLASNGALGTGSITISPEC